MKHIVCQVSNAKLANDTVHSLIAFLSIANCMQSMGKLHTHAHSFDCDLYKNSQFAKSNERTSHSEPNMLYFIYAMQLMSHGNLVLIYAINFVLVASYDHSNAQLRMILWNVKKFSSEHLKNLTAC